MFNVDKKDLNAFSIWNSVLHTPHFARGVYTKDGMYYYSSKQKGYNDRDRRICKFNEKWERANKYFDAAIEYLKDAFILVSYLKLEFSDYKKINDDSEEKKIKLTKIAEYLDELLSRDIKNFIEYYYMQNENDKKEYKVDSHYRYHYEHKKYFGEQNIEEYVKKYLFDNLYRHLNIFNYELVESIDLFFNPEFDKAKCEIEEKEEKFLEWK